MARLFRLERVGELLIEEEGSDIVADLWDGCDAALSSRLAYPEVRAAPAARRAETTTSTRTGSGVQNARGREYWAATRPVELTSAVERRAGELAGSHPLRGPHAVHLASALVLGDPGLVLAAWDRRLHAGARAVGLGVASVTL